MAIKKDTLDQLLDGRDPKEVFNKDGNCQEFCVRGHSDADGGRLWRSRKTPWTSFWTAVTRKRLSTRRRTVRNFVCEAIVTPTEGAYGDQERHPGPASGRP